jgi:predicted TIM-barrel fold metal-dependent hydrolase
MIIDWHTNIWLDEHLSAESRAHMSRSSLGRPTDGSPERHEREILPVAEKFVVIACRWPRCGFDVPNRWVADFVARHRDRAVGFACIDPRDRGAVAELDHAVNRLGMRGLKLAPTYQGYDPWCKEAWKLYEKADDLGIPILWHQAAAYPAPSMLEYANPVLLDRIARAFPRMKMILAHFGLPWSAETVQLMRKHTQVFTDVSARMYRPWEMYDAIMRARDYGVTDRILFGSDFPVQTTAEALATFRGLAGKFPEMPKIPESLIEDIITNRPLSLIWDDL